MSTTLTHPSRVDRARSARPAGVRPVVPAPRPAAGGSLRLTRRGRAVVLALALGVVLAVGVVLGNASSASEDAVTGETRVVTVGAGDTLWDIAAEVAAPGGTREMVGTLEDLNALDSAALQAGQKLLVPVVG